MPFSPPGCESTEIIKNFPTMSTMAGMFFVRSGTPGQDTPPSGCSVAESENVSEDDNTSCSASEMGCDLTTVPSSKESSSSSRKNKRKNFMPRNITEYAGSDEEEENNGMRGNHHRRANNNNNNITSNSTNNPVNMEIDPDESQPFEQEDDNSKNYNHAHPNDGEDDEESQEYVDRPIDFSKDRNDTKPVWRKPGESLLNPFSSINNNNSLSPSNSNTNLSSNNKDTDHHSPSVHNTSVLGNSFSFSPAAVDLRLANPRGHFPLSATHLHNQLSQESFEDNRSNEVITSSTSNHTHHLRSSSHPLHPQPPGPSPSNALFTEVAETTYEELLGLYRIAENLRQAGKPSPEIPGIQRNLESPGQPTKMMLPENMARLWAAMQETMSHHSGNLMHSPGMSSNHQQTSGNNGISHLNNSGSNSASPLNSLNMSMSPLSYVGLNNLVQQHQITSGSGNKSPYLPANTINNNNNHHNHNNNNSIFPGHGNQSFNKGLNKTPKSTGKSPSGRGLTPFPVIREGLLGKGTGPVDYTRYVRRYSNASECGYQQCRELNYREHFHCLDCGEGTRVFVKKEEMIRHFKWHKKRDESLQHGFMRYSPMDDCSDRFRNCTHNRKQTHYHCLQDGCEKVYISTSDVQMHANYHRKDSAIIQEGFQRFRAAEDCGTDHCSFRHQHTTHFHCRRTSCSYTFKNKADMEKHKTYHIKDEQLNRDGFKKFMKHEACHYANCRFSRVCNHIHCIREGCHYVLHSSGQLYSHKRKHERRDSELAYRKFKLAQSLMRGTIGLDILQTTNFNDSSSSFLNTTIKSEEEISHSPANVESILPIGEIDTEEMLKKFVQLCKCEAKDEEHYHCKVESCGNLLLGNAEAASEHSRNHEAEDRISSLAFFTVDPASFDAQDSTIPCISSTCQFQTREKHYHCLWDGCNETLLGTDSPFKRLEHFKAHSESSPRPELPEKCESLDGFLKTKRGRPPKNRVIEVSAGANEAIFTSFKLPKLFGCGALDDATDNEMKDPIGFLSYPEGITCPDGACVYNNGSTCHYHCGHPRCHFSVTDVHKLSLHLRDFHSNVDILEGYAYFDRNSDCKESNCEYSGSSEHFHCTRDGQGFLRYTAMITHESTVHESKSNGSSDDEDRQGNAGQIVKASGTFFPTASQRNEENGDGAMDLSSPNGMHGSSDAADVKPITDHSLSRILQLPSPESGETQYGPDLACGRPFCKLKRKCHFHCHLCNQAFSELEKLRPHVVKHSNFSSPIKAANESEGHSSDDDSRNDSDEQSESKMFPKITSDDIPASIKLESPSASFPPTSIHNFLGAYPGSHSPFLFMQQNPLFYAAAGMMLGNAAAGFPPGGVLSPTNPTGASLSIPNGNGTSPSSTPTSLGVGTSGGIVSNGIDSFPGALQLPPGSLHLPVKIKRPPSASSSSPSSPPDLKKQRLQMRILKDEPVPDGYIRFRFNEDCNYVHCGYREHQTHFHCTREDCGYSFCDKTRFVQHTARHERLDTLMGGDFKQFRANISCGRTNCSYVPNICGAQGQNKASHFHCSKCDFVCTDTNKVVAHRRQHQKLDSIMAAGFEKFTPSQNCHIDSCIHAQKQTHYHCLKCSYAVLGLSQMSAHKFRHVD